MGYFRIEFIEKPRKKDKGMLMSNFNYALLIAVRNQNPDDFEALMTLLNKIWTGKK